MKIRDQFLPYCLPFYDEAEIDGVVDAIRSNWWARGPKVSEFQDKFAQMVGARYAVAMNSCTAALHIGLLAYGVGPGDEVITTPMTFCSTANTIVHTGARPVFADIIDSTGLIDPEQIKSKITPRTKAIVPVHYAGNACDMDAINDIAQRHGLRVLEDAAHAVCTTYKGKTIGNSDNLTAFSFYATKNLATGEGGMLTTNDEKLAATASVMALHGMSKNAWNRYTKGGSWRYDVVHAGYKYNMNDIAAALGLAQMDKLSAMQETRRRYAAMYDEAFASLPGIGLLDDVDYGENAHHLYAIRVREGELSIDRDEFIDLLTQKYNIGTSVHFIPVHLHPFYKERFGTREGDFPVTERFFNEEISLPLYPKMTEDDVKYVAQAVREIAREHANG